MASSPSVPSDPGFRPFLNFSYPDTYFPPSFDPNKYPSYNNGLGVNGKILLTAIISLFVVVILVVLLHIYARCVLRRQAARQATLRRLSMGAVAWQVQNEQPKRGLDASVFASLPIFVYKQQTEQDQLGGATTTECAVCLSSLEEEERVRLLPNCKHLFHVQCIDMWLDSHTTCPVCRTEAEPQPKPEPGESSTMMVQSSAPTVDSLHPATTCSEGTSDGAAQSSSKVGGSSSRMSSFRRMLSRERSGRRIQPCEQADAVEDVERQ
ncbi:PREDICTED: E3 ubiquitin-protein ligase ATL41-like [Nelumbo nucifera]|uniref:RING-type E3 ubiquitin transferase n=1 Tax=Nelumbo nucifera TaxID=4432 RepID=A0A1U8BCR8_NELNU|nr:PREDICTED: E3 ubiquitin-protein ligase ATL41-like [Nelumbo nucifera]